MSIAYEGILAVAAVTRRNGSQAEARCPHLSGHEHDDRSAGLGIGVRTSGDPGAVIYCQAGCDVEDVMRAWDLPMAALFDSWWEHRNGSGHRAQTKIVESYDYVDGEGRLLFQVCRKSPKGFSQRRRSGNGGWVWDLKGTRRVLYRLPQVAEAVAAGRRVWVVEGEKDVHALEAAGEVATCNPGGAGSWKDEYAEVLRGATVMIVADRDEAGRKHALKVAASLEGVAAGVRVGEAAVGKDASDHLAAGRGLGEFVPATPEPSASEERAEVDTAALLAAIEGFIRRFVVLPDRASYLTTALFVLHTWGFDSAFTTPYLVVESPEKQSGKTRLLEVLELVCRAPVKTASITAAALFQTVAAGAPTLLIDEADAIFAGNSERNEDLRGVLNAGNAAGSKVIRGGKDGKPVAYGVFCPKVIAGIATGKLPDTIRDRAIVVPIDRKLRSESVERMRKRRLADEVGCLRGVLDLWATQHAAVLERYDLPEPIERISDRMEEAWEPLLGIAELAGGECPALARAAAEDLSGDGHDDDSTSSHGLLVALHDVFGDKEKMFTKDLVAALNADGDLPFGAWSDGGGIKAIEIARLLRRYRIKSRKVNIAGATLQGYRREEFKTAWERYGGLYAGTPGTSQHRRGISGFRQPESEAQGSGSGEGEKPRGIREVPEVPAKRDPEALFGENDDPDGTYEALLDRTRSKFGEAGL